MRKDRRFGVILALALVLLPWAGEGASRCRFPRKSQALLTAKRNFSFSARWASEADAQRLRALQPELNRLAAREVSFIRQAGALEKECRALVGLYGRLRSRWGRIEAEIKATRAEYENVLLKEAMKLGKDKEALNGPCPGERKEENVKIFSPEKWKRCKPLLDAHNARVDDWERRADKNKEREKTLEAERRKIRASLDAQRKKYRAKAKAYLAGRKPWENRIRRFSAKIHAITKSAREAAAKARQERAAREARREAARKLRGQVKGMQEALRRLDRSIRGDAAERARWERATQEAMQDSWNRGKGMIVDESLGVLGKRLDKRLDGVNQRLRSARKRLFREKVPHHQKRLRGAIARFKKQHAEIERAKGLVVDRLSDAKKITDTVDYATGRPEEMEKSLRGVYEIAKTTLGDPKVQKALKIGGGYAAGAGYAQSIVDSSFDIAREAVSWRRIRQLNRNSEEYLKAVGRLKEKMEKAMRKIHRLEGKK